MSTANPPARARGQLLAAVGVAAGGAVCVLGAAWAVFGGSAVLGRTALVGAGVLAALVAVGVARPALIRRPGRLLERTVQVAGGAAVASALFAFVVAGLGEPATDADRDALGRAVAGALVAATGWVLIRGHLMRRATRWAHGDQEDPAAKLERFRRRLTRELPLEELLLQAAEALSSAFDLGRAEIWTGTGRRFERTVALPAGGAATLELAPDAAAAVAGVRAGGRAWAGVWLPDLVGGAAECSGPLLVCPAVDAGTPLALVVAERAPGAPEFDELAQQLVVDLARALALALRNAGLDAHLQASAAQLRSANAELRSSRARVVAAGDAERRRIERDLHDGAQHHLVALALRLGLARESAAGTAVGAELDGLVEQVEAAITAFRDVARGIYPPLLAHAGPGAALADAVTRLPASIHVEAAGLARHDEAIETAVYFCCLEAIQNAVRHAPGAAVTVRLSTGADRLRFEVRDDGPGFEPAAIAAGRGRTTIADRVGAVGGTVRWDTAPGRGTAVRGEIPVPNPDPRTSPIELD